MIDNETMETKSIIESFNEALKTFLENLPTIIGVIFLIALFKTFVSKDIIRSIFTNNLITDTFTGTVIGSISTGNPITSYILGGEFLNMGVSLFAVTAFIVAWVTVGIIQLPAEIATLGKRFAIIRNATSFVLAIFVSICTVIVMMVV